ncbi:MAG: peptide-methionine (R)-S-oxide reductase MsrB [Candidatus Paceibacterota bacterium]
MKHNKTDAEWHNLLTPQQYRVMREQGTEPPFSGKLIEKNEGGVYTCSACGSELFSVDAKFESGSGWPSFDKAIKGAVIFNEDDSGLEKRVEVQCADCGSHLGHVFNDGPEESTGKRYCINAVCLK